MAGNLYGNEYRDLVNRARAQGIQGVGDLPSTFAENVAAAFESFQFEDLSVSGGATLAHGSEDYDVEETMGFRAEANVGWEKQKVKFCFDSSNLGYDVSVVVRNIEPGNRQEIANLVHRIADKLRESDIWPIADREHPSGI